MKIEDLIVTQNDLRNWNEIPEMILFVKNGFYWTKDQIDIYNKAHNIKHSSSLISIVQFKEDNNYYIHDGHHRVYSTFKGGRSHLIESEYIFLYKDETTKELWSYEDYDQFNPYNNWYTPYNPLTHIRLSNFFDFKETVKQKLNFDSFSNVEKWVIDNSNLYKIERTKKNIFDLEK